MARKLKVYRTAAGGFFELTVAAPSMKAAAQAWGSDSDVFKRGFAEQTDDPKVIKAAMATPGVVLRRPVGSNGEFTEHSQLPKEPRDHRPSGPERVGSDKKSSRQVEEKAKRERDRQALEREKMEAAERERARKERERMMAKADADLEKARTRHNKAMETLTRRREELDRDQALETERWETEQRRHSDALKQR